MNIVKYVLLALMLLGATVATAKPSDEALATSGRVLDAMGTEVALREMTQSILDLQFESNPELTPYRGVMNDFMNKYMSYAALRDDIAEIYATEFTLEELRAAEAFYTSPEGKRFTAMLPRLMKMGGELGERRVTEHAAELQAAILAEKKRLDAEGKKSGMPGEGLKK